MIAEADVKEEFNNSIMFRSNEFDMNIACVLLETLFYYRMHAIIICGMHKFILMSDRFRLFQFSTMRCNNYGLKRLVLDLCEQIIISSSIYYFIGETSRCLGSRMNHFIDQWKRLKIFAEF